MEFFKKRAIPSPIMTIMLIAYKIPVADCVERLFVVCRTIKLKIRGLTSPQSSRADIKISPKLPKFKKILPSKEKSEEFRRELKADASWWYKALWPKLKSTSKNLKATAPSIIWLLKRSSLMCIPATVRYQCPTYWAERMLPRIMAPLAKFNQSIGPWPHRKNKGEKRQSRKPRTLKALNLK